MSFFHTFKHEQNCLFIITPIDSIFLSPLMISLHFSPSLSPAFFVPCCPPFCPFFLFNFFSLFSHILFLFFIFSYFLVLAFFCPILPKFIYIFTSTSFLHTFTHAQYRLFVRPPIDSFASLIISLSSIFSFNFAWLLRGSLSSTLSFLFSIFSFFRFLASAVLLSHLPQYCPPRMTFTSACS